MILRLKTSRTPRIQYGPGRILYAESAYENTRLCADRCGKIHRSEFDLRICLRNRIIAENCPAVNMVSADVTYSEMMRNLKRVFARSLPDSDISVNSPIDLKSLLHVPFLLS